MKAGRKLKIAEVLHKSFDLQLALVLSEDFFDVVGKVSFAFGAKL